MTTAFTDQPDLSAYVAVPRAVPFVPNPPLSELTGMQRAWAEASDAMDFRTPDAAPEELLNRAIWYGVKGFVPYPGDGRVLSPAEVTAKFGAETEDEDEAERAGGEEEEGEGLELTTSGLGVAVAVAGLLLCVLPAVPVRRVRLAT
jgi:hypothetical protein